MGQKINSKIPYGTLVPIVSLKELRFITLTPADLNSRDLSREALPLIMSMFLRCYSYRIHWKLREKSSGFLFQYKRVTPTSAYYVPGTIYYKYIKLV